MASEGTCQYQRGKQSLSSEKGCHYHYNVNYWKVHYYIWTNLSLNTPYENKNKIIQCKVPSNQRVHISTFINLLHSACLCSKIENTTTKNRTIVLSILKHNHKCDIHKRMVHNLFNPLPIKG